MSGLGSKLFVSCVLLLQAMPKCASFDYADALTKSILFFEAQRSGRLPPNQRVTWRANSGLKDGQAAGVDLEGGYYDAGDNVKFGMPMAYTITMLSWSAVAYRLELQNAQQFGYVLDAIKWGTDYLIKAHPEPNVLYGEVGDGSTDHECWQRPEDMTTPRLAYRVDSRNPGSDLAGETAAAMAAASMAFRHSDASYSTLLLHHARQLFTFADTYRGKYDNSIQVAQKFYASRSGYMDELLWSAMWLYEATRESYYLAYVANNAKALGGTGWSMTEFSWDVKFSGVQILASKVLLEGKGQEYASTLEKYQEQAEFFLCACLQKNYGAKVQRTPGGLMFVRSWNNIQYVTSASFLLTVYSDYLSSSRQQLNCYGTKVEAYELLNLAKSQVDYILGNNPRATSYMVGFGGNYPRHIHHRASSIISYKVDSSFVSCRGGYATWYTRKENDPNVLVGALVGGPDQNDNFADQRENYEQTEPATYNNGPIVGVLARLLTFHSYNQPLQAISSSSLSAHVEQKSAAVEAKARDSRFPRSTMLVTQRLLTSWIQQNRTHHKYEATITNRSKQIVSQCTLKIAPLYGPSRGRTKTSYNSSFFASFPHSLLPGKSFDFIYIHTAPQTEIAIVKYHVVQST